MSVRFDQNGEWGVIVLEKPSTFNALNLQMVLEIRQFLKEAEYNQHIQGVLIQSAVAGVFCAGGDIKEVHQWCKSGNQDALFHYIEEEYGLNQQISLFPKPTVAIMDGLTLGGGVGLSRYTDYRIASDKALVGMPEIKIAFFPDVGAGYFLNLLEKPLARFLALTGYLLKGQDLIDVGYATHLISSSRLDSIIDEILRNRGDKIDSSLIVQYNGESELKSLQPLVQCFNHPSLLECMNALASASEQGKKLYKEMLKFSPLALHIVWEYIEICRGLSYETVVQIDLNLAKQIFKKSDIEEGIRTRLIDKGSAPKWLHHSISEVIREEIEAYFKPLEALYC